MTTVHSAQVVSPPAPPLPPEVDEELVPVDVGPEVSAGLSHPT
jgi:hypothetical protein